MAEIEITLPTVQYGNVKVRATPEELGVDIASPAAVGTATAVYLNLFTQGFKTGASLNVSASPTEGLNAPAGGVQGLDEVRAQALLDEGLGGVTEVPDGPLNQHPDDGPEESDDAPWNSTVDAKPKPWETGETAPKAVVTEGW